MVGPAVEMAIDEIRALAAGTVPEALRTWCREWVGALDAVTPETPTKEIDDEQ